MWKTIVPISLGILLMAGSGIWVLINHGVLERGPAQWELAIPFTAGVAIEDAGDAVRVKSPKLLDAKSSGSLRILNPGSAREELPASSTVDRETVWKVVAPLAKEKKQALDAARPDSVSQEMQQRLQELWPTHRDSLLQALEARMRERSASNV